MRRPFGRKDLPRHLGGQAAVTTEREGSIDHSAHRFRPGTDGLGLDRFRLQYLDVLAKQSIWTPRRSSSHRTIIVMDWDDTLLPSCYLNLRVKILKAKGPHRNCAALDGSSATSDMLPPVIEQPKMQVGIKDEMLGTGHQDCGADKRRGQAESDKNRATSNVSCGAEGPKDYDRDAGRTHSSGSDARGNRPPLPPRIAYHANQGEIQLRGMKQVAAEQAELLEALQCKLVSLINAAKREGTVKIVTNAAVDWVHVSSRIYLPRVWSLLFKRHDIEVISAREKFEHATSDSREWKIRVFNELRERIEETSPQVVNFISIGDSWAENEAASRVAQHLGAGVVKSVKLKASPTLMELIEQHDLLAKRFHFLVATSDHLRIELS